MDNKLIVNNVREMCKRQNMSITELELNLEMSQGLISRWAKKEPSLSKLIAIADYFNVSVDKILGRDKSDDEFIAALQEKTLDRTLNWVLSNNFESLYLKKYVDIQLDEENYNQVIYVSQYYEGYISLHCIYKINDVYEPIELKLFIQPENNSDMIIQNYSSNELKILWFTILNNSNDVPDELKATELKNRIIRQTKSSPKVEGVLAKEYENIKPILEGIDLSAIKELQKTLENQNVRRILAYFSKLSNKDIDLLEDQADK